MVLATERLSDLPTDRPTGREVNDATCNQMRMHGLCAIIDLRAGHIDQQWLMSLAAHDKEKEQCFFFV